MWSFANKMMIGLTILVCISQIVLWYGDLPEMVPSHFDANGEVDGEMSRNAFCAMMGLINLGMLICLPLTGYLAKHLPNSLVNIPNKDYWLAPARRDASLTLMTDFVSAIAWMTGWLFIGIFQLSALVGIKARETISPEFYFFMGFYLVGVIAVMVIMSLKFRKPVEDASSPAESLGSLS
ncbi:MAG: DUF1648 domain-containing protein [Mariniblastus sp.]